MPETKHYADSQGNYLGAFVGVTPLEGWVEVSEPSVINVSRITAGQFMQQLILDGKDELAESIIAGITDNVERKRIRARYDRESYFVISDPDLLMLAGAVGYNTPQKIQDFFNAASIL